MTLGTKKIKSKSLSVKGTSYSQTLTAEFHITVEKYLKKSPFASVQELTRVALAEYMEKHPKI